MVPAVTATRLPARSRNDLIGEPFFTSTLVPETKMVGEKLTRFCRSRLLVVEPHSRSTVPRSTASMRESEVTGTHLIARLLFTASSMAVTSSRQSSIE